MRQTLALLIDAYRDLNSRKLFWITLIISGVVIASLATIGVDGDAITFFRMRWEMHGFIDPGLIYRTVILGFAVIGIWLTWGAIALALISTAGLFPDLISSGSIDLYLSKPISRTRLFFTKYVTGLLFVALQVSLFIFGCFVVMGVRVHDWRPSLFWGVPVVVAMFSYLFSFSTLIGIWTRSGVAAILLTVLFWLLLGLVQRVEPALLSQQLSLEHAIARVDSQVRVAPTTYNQKESQDLKSNDRWLSFFHSAFAWTQAILPKTTETTGLLDRYLISQKEVDTMLSSPNPNVTSYFGATQYEQNMADRQVQHELLDRSPFSIIGSSLLCELVVLLIAGWLFCRRDY